MQKNTSQSAFATWLKLLLVPLIFISFAHPIEGVWSASSTIFHDNTMSMAVRTLIGCVYLGAFIFLANNAYKNLELMGTVVVLLLAGVVIWTLVSINVLSLNSRTEFGWTGIGLMTIFGWIGLFGAPVYRAITGRRSADVDFN